MMKISLDYLAGIIDGEGCINIGKVPRAFLVRLKIASTNFELIELLRENFGGCIGNGYVDKNKNHKQSKYIQWNGKYALDLLEKVKDKLIVKREQVELILQFPILSGKDMNTEEMKEFREMIYQMMKLLNKRGK